jgi:hypothetical protein
MKRILFWLFVIVLAALNWAAWHDILNGEKNVWAEWATVVATVLLLIAYLIRKSREAKEG